MVKKLNAQIIAAVVAAAGVVVVVHVVADVSLRSSNVGVMKHALSPPITKGKYR